MLQLESSQFMKSIHQNLEEEQERISTVNYEGGLILDEGPTYKVVLRGNAMIPLVFDEIQFGSELHKLIDLVLRNVPTF